MTGNLADNIAEILPMESLIEFFAVAVAAVTITMLWKFRKSPEVKYMIFVELLAGIWAFTYGMEFSSYTLQMKIIWSQLSYLGIAFLPVLYFLFTTAFSQKYHLITPLHIVLLSIIPFITLPITFTNGYHNLFWSEVRLSTESNMLLYQRGIWFWIYWIYAIVLIFSGLYNLFDSIHKFTSYYKSQVSILLIATLVPLIGNVMYVTNLNPIPGFDWTPVLFVFSGIVINFGIVRYRIFDLVPFARNQAIDTMSNGVIVINPEGFIEDFNPAVINIFKSDGRSSVRKHHTEIFRHYNEITAAIEQKQYKPKEIEIKVDKNIYLVRISSVYNDKKVFSGHLVQINDITSLKRTEQRLKKLNSLLKDEVIKRGKLIDDLDSFAHTVAHDLNNSLGNIYASSEIIQDAVINGDRESLEDVTRLVKEAAKKAMRITHELLILSTLSNEEIAGRPLDMKRIFAGAKNQINDTIERNNAEIIEPESWPVALGYDAWVEEVWVNYLTNAIKYGGSPPRIMVGAENKGSGKIEYWIQDNGIGITLENQKKLFKKYTRLAPEKADGYGLGLSIVKRIVEKLNGTVGIESSGEKGKGSRFWFKLPAN